MDNTFDPTPTLEQALAYDKAVLDFLGTILPEIEKFDSREEIFAYLQEQKDFLEIDLEYLYK